MRACCLSREISHEEPPSQTWSAEQSLSGDSGAVAARWQAASSAVSAWLEIGSGRLPFYERLMLSWLSGSFSPQCPLSVLNPGAVGALPGDQDGLQAGRLAGPWRPRCGFPWGHAVDEKGHRMCRPWRDLLNLPTWVAYLSRPFSDSKPGLPKCIPGETAPSVTQAMRPSVITYPLSSLLVLVPPSSLP